MPRGRDKRAEARGLTAGVALGLSAAMLAVPASVLAFGAESDSGVSLAARGSFAAFTPATVDPKLAKLVAERTTGNARHMRFTPAAAANRPDRSVTVAIKVDADTARAISARPSTARASSAATAVVAAANPVAVQIAPTRYDLGLARGYKSFAPSAVAVATSTATGSNALPKGIRNVDMPDLATFKPREISSGKPSRFGATIELEEAKRAGRAPGTIDGQSDQTVDVTGSYSVTRNLDVTAGVRYSQERDADRALSNGMQDSQSVYIGTQFRF